MSTMTGDPLDVGWRLDDQPLHDGPELAFDPEAFELENVVYALEAVVWDPTAWVSLDPEEQLVSRHLWNITVVGEGPDGGLPLGDASSSDLDALVEQPDAGAGGQAINENSTCLFMETSSACKA